MNPLSEPANVPARPLRCWLARTPVVWRFWLGKPSVAAAWIGLVLAAVMPPHGMGVGLCWVQAATGIPCPGCGLTRSLSCGLRGLFSESWHYHPMGLFILTLFLFIAGQSLFPRTIRNRLRDFMQSRPVFFNGCYLVFVSMFVSFGIFRALLHCVAMGTHIRF